GGPWPGPGPARDPMPPWWWREASSWWASCARSPRRARLPRREDPQDRVAHVVAAPVHRPQPDRGHLPGGIDEVGLGQLPRSPGLAQRAPSRVLEHGERDLVPLHEALE